MSEFKDFAISVAKETGQLLMDNYERMHQLEWKLRTNFKVEVDDQSDGLIRRRIRENFPEHNIWSEEQDAHKTDSEFTWVIDPLDGTIGYTRGFTDNFSVCVGLAKEGIPILGVIFAPKRKELYVAEEGKGAFCNGQKIHVSDQDNINHAVILAGAGKETDSFKRTEFLPYYERLMSPNGVVDIVNTSCASVYFCKTAEGKLDGAIALSLEPWDMAAAVVILREAGAKVTNISGRDWTLKDPSILAANPKLHKKLYELVKDLKGELR